MLTGLLVGEAKAGTVRSSVFAPADYQPARISDFFTTHRVSPQKLMAKLTEVVLRLCYGSSLPERLYLIADNTNTEKPYAGRARKSKSTSTRPKNLGEVTIRAAPVQVFAGGLF